jgi:hypothetical protein
MSGEAKARMAKWKRDPYCYRCGRLTHLVCPLRITHRFGDGKLMLISGGPMPTPESATLEHTVSRMDERWGKVEQRVVISCNEHNQAEGRREYMTLDFEERARRGHRLPGWMPDWRLLWPDPYPWP